MKGSRICGRQHSLLNPTTPRILNPLTDRCVDSTSVCDWEASHLHPAHLVTYTHSTRHSDNQLSDIYLYYYFFFFFFCHYHYIPISHYMGWGDMLKYVPGGRDIREIPCFLDRGWWRIAQSSLLGRYAWSNPELNAEYLIQIWGWR